MTITMREQSSARSRVAPGATPSPPGAPVDVERLSRRMGELADHQLPSSCRTAERFELLRSYGARLAPGSAAGLALIELAGMLAWSRR